MAAALQVTAEPKKEAVRQAIATVNRIPYGQSADGQSIKIDICDKGICTMKTRIFGLGLVAMLLTTSAAWAQCSSCGSGSYGGSVEGNGYTGSGSSLGGGVNADMANAVCVPSISGYPRRTQSLRYAHQDHFSPHPVYAYSRAGINAQREDQWNTNQAQQYAWHGDYSYWRWGAPTAMVVPPTAAYQSEYNWGVAQTRSMPIYHQFGSGSPSLMGSGAGQYPNTPYWPSSTNQFGVYPVRGPWH